MTRQAARVDSAAHQDLLPRRSGGSLVPPPAASYVAEASDHRRAPWARVEGAVAARTLGLATVWVRASLLFRRAERAPCSARARYPYGAESSWLTPPPPRPTPY